MSHEAATTIASTIQSASLNRAPSPTHDANPSTAASRKIPAELHPPPSSSQSPPPRSHSQFHSRSRSPSLSSSLLDQQPSLTITPRARRTTFPPLPDFRFEQSYLSSLKNADTTAKVVWITLRDQLMLPLLQGTLWNLAIYGWRHWNRGVKFAGEGVGARVRRWWWGVNGWRVPEKKQSQTSTGRGGWEGEKKLAAQVEEFYEGQFSTATGD